MVVRRTCKTCRKNKPLTAKFFHPHGAGRAGFRWECRECRNANRARVYRRAAENPDYRQRRAKETNDWYYRNRSRALKSQREYTERSEVKRARNARERRRRAEDRIFSSALKEYHRLWRERNRSHLAAYRKLPKVRLWKRKSYLNLRSDPIRVAGNKARVRSWRHQNLDSVRRNDRLRARSPESKDRHKVYLLRYLQKPENKEKLRESARRWRSKNPEKVRVLLRNRRARLLSAPGKHSADDIERLLKKQEFRCYWCFSDISNGRCSVDHYIPLIKGGSNGSENIVMACRSCNSRKNALMPDEFRKRLAAR